jgi:hypothetical protein
LGAQQIDATTGTSCLHGLRESSDPSHRSDRLATGKFVTSQRRGSFGVPVQPDAGLPLCLLTSAFGGRRVHADDCTPQDGSELAERQPTRVRKHLVLDRRHIGLAQDARGLRDQPGA